MVLNTKDFAPALALYSPETVTVEVTATDVVITIGSTILTVPYVNKTLQEVAAQISSSSATLICNPLNRSGPMGSGFLYFDSTTDRTIDDAQIIRMYAHSVKYLEETKIRLLPPYPDNRLLPWYPRVDRGSLFIYRHGVKHLFSVPEYADQEWSALFGFPYVDQFSARVEFLAPKLLRVGRTPIHWVGNNVGLTVNGQPLGASIIQDVDVHNGFIRLTTELANTDVIRVSYTYEERALVYKNVNLNPSMEHNPAVIDQAVLVYLVPTFSSNGQKRRQTVQHLVSKTLTGALSSLPVSTEPYLIIGAYQVRPSGVIQDVKLTDTRSRGGGIAEERWEQALRKNREVYSIADFGRYDGVPFPAAASGVLVLPKSILDRLDNDYIEQQVQRHLATGGHILIDYSAPGSQDDFDLTDFEGGDFD